MPNTHVPIATGQLDLDAGVLTTASGPVSLTPTEVGLLRHLWEEAEPVPVEDLLNAVWGYREGVKSRTVTVTVERLRKKIEADPKNPVSLVTVKGQGYALHTLAAPTDVPGRDAEWAALDAAQGAIVTLVGPAGIGKTTLARAWARRHRYVFVPLERASAVEDLCAAVMDTFGAPGPVTEPCVVAGRLCHGHTVVLDNFEQLPDEAAVKVGRWSEGGARFVVTSQHPLGLDGEVVLPIGPLNEVDARRVLRDGRTAAGLPALDPEVVERWLPRLGGVPLVLEISAPLLDFLDGVDDLLDLPRERADGPERHASVGQALTWTCDRLPEDARRFLDALAFAAGTMAIDEVAQLAGLSRAQALSALRRCQARGLVHEPEPGLLDVLPVVRAHLRRSHPRPQLLVRAHAELVAAWPLSVNFLRPRMPEIRVAADRAEGAPLLAVLERLFEVLQAAGPGVEAPRRIQKALDRLPPADRARGEVLLAEALVLAHRPEELFQLTPYLAPDDDGWSVRWHGIRSHAFRWLGDREQAAEAGRVCLGWGERSGDALLLALARGYYGMAIQDTEPDEAAAVLTRAIDGLVRHGRHREALVGELARANALSRIDPSVDVANRVRARRRTAEADGVGQLTVGLASAVMSLILYDAGDVRSGKAAADEALAALGDDAVHVAEFALHLALRQLHAPEQAAETLELVPPDQPGVGLQLRRMVQALVERDRYLLDLVDDDDLRLLGHAFLDGGPIPEVKKALRTRLGLLAVLERIREAPSGT